MFEIPTQIQIGDKQLAITNKGDYRMVLDCFVALNDIEMTKEERVICALLIFYEDFKTVEDVLTFENLATAVEEMYTFFNCGNSTGIGCARPHNLVDWKGDAQLVASAINKVAGTEVRFLEYLHWWTFMGYYLAIGESPLATIVGIRNKIAEGKKLEKYEKEFRNDNPQYFIWDSKTLEEKEAEQAVMSLWNSSD